MEPEIWQWIPNYGWYYMVSTHGKVRSRRLGREIHIAPDKDGYLRCSLYKRGIRKMFRVHQLVALTFLEKPDGCTEVNHKDGNRQNNHVENLEWVTREQNILLRDANRGTDDINVVDAESNKIIAMCHSVTEASRFAHVSTSTIREIIGTNNSTKGYRFEVGF